MRSALAIITYRRCDTLKTMLSGLAKFCGHYPTSIWEDCGQRDGTADFLKLGREPHFREDLLAYEYAPLNGVDHPPVEPNYPNYRVFMGERNLGVAGNSNRAIRWFLEETEADHLCLCNDDLHVHGDFVKFYAQGHADLGVGMFCFCDFTAANYPRGETYKWTTYQVRGYGIKFLPRFTGIMLSLSRKLLEKVGYFDAAFGKWGEEHSDFTIRCRSAGGIQIDGQDMNCLDLEHTFLSHQDCGSSMAGPVREAANLEASLAMQKAAHDYKWRSYYRPFRLALPKMAGGYSGGGIAVNNLLDCGCQLVTALAR